jgi:hypothetical protein
MGEGWQGIEANHCGDYNSGRGSGETHCVGIGSQEDRGGSKSEMGDDSGSEEESCVKYGRE